MVRLIGGVLYLAGMIVMAYNVWRTVRGGTPAPQPVQAASAPVTPGVTGLNAARQGH